MARISIPEIDPARMRALSRDFTRATGMPLMLVDPEGREAWSMGACPLAAMLSGSARRTALCRGHRRTAVQESLRWGEAYISVCPFGLITFAVPVFSAGHLAGGLVSGFSILPQMKDDIRQDLRRRLRLLGMRPQPGRWAKMRLRVVSSETLRESAAELFDATARAGMNDPRLLRESREKSAQQLTIANFLSEVREGKEDVVASLVAVQNEIIDSVVLGDLVRSREIINRYLGLILLETGMSFDMLKVRLLELIVIISRAAIEKGISAQGLLGPRYSYLTDLNATTGFDDLFWKVTTILENFTTAVSQEMRRKGWAHVTQMKECVKKGFTTKLSAAEVAASAGLSVSRAEHLFRKEVGMTISSWVSRQRIAYAKYLLERTDRTMAEVAAECGFYDQSHFTKTFSSNEAVTPLRYRMRARGESGATGETAASP
jgi:two-component system, response regulator YesN